MNHLTGILLSSLALATFAWAGEPALRVENPWVFAVPPGAKDTAAFMTFVNTGTVPVRVTGGRTDAAARLAPMITTKHEGQMGMKDVQYLEVPAKGRLALAPGGDHLMIYGLKSPLKAGEPVALSLTLEPGGKLEVKAIVSKREPK